MYNAFLVSGFFLLVLTAVVVAWLMYSSMKGFLFDREKSSKFECGFDNKDSSRMTFSMRFFLVVMLFMVFDIELCFMFNFPFELSNFNFNHYEMVFGFLVIIVLGTFEEWRRGVLVWKVG